MQAHIADVEVCDEMSWYGLVVLKSAAKVSIVILVINIKIDMVHILDDLIFHVTMPILTPPQDETGL